MAEIAFKYWREKEQSAAVNKKGSKTPPPLRAKPKRIPEKSALVDLDSSTARVASQSAETFEPREQTRRRDGRPLSSMDMTLPSNYAVTMDLDRVPNYATLPPPPPTFTSTISTTTTAIASRSSSSGDSSGSNSFVETADLGKTGSRRSLFLLPIVPPERPPPPKRWSLHETKQEAEAPSGEIAPDSPFLVQKTERRATSSRDRTKDERCLSLVSEEGMSAPPPTPPSPPTSLGEGARPTSQAPSARHPRLAWLPRSQSVGREKQSSVLGEDSGKTTPTRARKRQPTKSESFVSYVQEEEGEGQSSGGHVEVGCFVSLV